MRKFIGGLLAVITPLLYAAYLVGFVLFLIFVTIQAGLSIAAVQLKKGCDHICGSVDCSV